MVVPSRLHCAAAAAASPAAQQRPPQRIAVIGGGFAGLAVSWHLLAAARQQGTAMQLQLFDAVGLGAGGSGAAAGLLHPYTPRGKVGAEGSSGPTYLMKALAHGLPLGTARIHPLCPPPRQMLWQGLEAFEAAAELLQAAEAAAAAAATVPQAISTRHVQLDGLHRKPRAHPRRLQAPPRPTARPPPCFRALPGPPLVSADPLGPLAL